MAGSSFFALIDDIASILDDVATMTKVAAKKTTGMLSDDLALNAQQVNGINAARELPVVWAVAVGSLKNKAILVPAALAISAFAAWLISPLLMLGGAYLCYEGFEKLAHQFMHHNSAPEEASASADHEPTSAADSMPRPDEQEKIRGAIRTDFILSAEIITITLGTVSHAALLQQVIVLIGIAIIMTVGVYGLVAAIVKLDDGGLYLLQQHGNNWFRALQRAIGRRIINAAPWMMKGLSVIGTIAMFMVGGGILTHGIAPIHHAIASTALLLAPLPAVGSLMAFIAPALLDALFGIIAGAVVLILVNISQALLSRMKKNTSPPGH